MSISESEKKWFDFTSQFVDKLNKNNGDWRKLSESEQELAALWKLEMDMHNGGFLQFFTNWGVECYENAVRCLHKIKAEKPLRIITAAYKVIDKYKDDKRLGSYQDLFDIISETEVEKINQLDQEYWRVSDCVIELTFEFYKKLQGIDSERTGCNNS